MERAIIDIGVFLAGAAIVGLIKLAPSGIKGALAQLVKDVAELKLLMKEFVIREVCDAHREKMAADINNLGAIVRQVRGDKND